MAGDVHQMTRRRRTPSNPSPQVQAELAQAEAMKAFAEATDRLAKAVEVFHPVADEAASLFKSLNCFGSHLVKHRGKLILFACGLAGLVSPNLATAIKAAFGIG